MMATYDSEMRNWISPKIESGGQYLEVLNRDLSDASWASGVVTPSVQQRGVETFMFAEPFPKRSEAEISRHISRV